MMERGRWDIFTHVEEKAASVTFCLGVWSSSSDEGVRVRY